MLRALLFVGLAPSVLCSLSTKPRATCEFTDAATVMKQKYGCSTITLNGINVPAGTTLDLTGLNDDTHVKKLLWTFVSYQLT